jgi:alkylation response protein AidB-like acyl-CoA dehydrogenase
MDFSYSEEQLLLRDAIDKFLQKNYAFEQRREIIHSREGMSAAVWEGFASLGLHGVPIPEAFGGFGGGGVDVMLVMEALGRALVVEPYLSSVIMAGYTIALGGSDAQRSILLPRIADGSMKFAFGHSEPGSRYELDRVRTTARQEGGMWIIDGAKSVMMHGGLADLLIISARTSGEADSPEGISLFFVNPAEQGVMGREYPTYDGMRAAEVTFDNVTISPESIIGVLDSGYALLEAVTDRGIAAVCAEAVGCMDAVKDATLEYLKTRQQFGVPIGKFQALQHRLVDMLIQTEQARSMAMLAAVKVDSPDIAERRRCVAAAKELIGRAGRFVGQQAIQLHGGMGMTDELPLGHYVKRLAAIETLFGDGDMQLDRFAATQVAAAEAPLRKAAKKWKNLV